MRIRDGMVCMFRTGASGDRVVGVGMHRPVGGTRVTAKQLKLIEFAIAELRRAVDRGHVALPPNLSPARLSPRLTQILDMLLAGAAPKVIARRLGLSLWTVREHVQRLYKWYGVSGRDELMARFVSMKVDDPPA